MRKKNCIIIYYFKTKELFLCLVLLYVSSIMFSSCSTSEVNANDIALINTRLGKILVIKTWDFYPNQLVDKKPSSTNFHDSQKIKNGAWAFINQTKTVWKSGTYEQKVVAKIGEKIGLNVSLVHSSYRVWADDEMILEVGYPSISPNKTIYQIKTGVAQFQAKRDTSTVYIEVANYEDKLGGIMRPISIGNYDQISNLRERNLLIDSLVNIMVLSLAFYNILLYWFENRSKAYLFFGIFCIFEVVRAFSIGIIAWSIFITDLTLTLLNIFKLPSFFLGFGFATLYFHHSLNGLYKFNLEKVVFGLSLFTALIFIVVPPSIEFYVTLIFEFIAFTFALYSLYLIFKKTQSGNPSAWIPFWGLALFLFTLIYDILVSSAVINSEFISHIGTLGIAIAQSFYLGKQHLDTLKKLDAAKRDNLEFAILNKTQTQEKNELLHELKLIKSAMKSSEGAGVLEQLIQKVSVNDFLNQQRKLIYENSNQLNNEFFQKLSEKYPQLNQTGKEYFALFRLKLDTKGIAIVKGISPDSVKVIKNRLRRKLDLPLGTDLYEIAEHI